MDSARALESMAEGLRQDGHAAFVDVSYGVPSTLTCYSTDNDGNKNPEAEFVFTIQH